MGVLVVVVVVVVVVVAATVVVGATDVGRVKVEPLRIVVVVVELLATVAG